MLHLEFIMELFLQLLSDHQINLVRILYLNQ